MFNIDVPTAFAAVLISISLSFVRDNVTDIIQSQIKSTTKDYEEKIDWLDETEAIAEQVEGLVISLQAESKGVESTKSDVLEQIEEITLEDVNSIEEYRSELDDIVGLNQIDIQYENQGQFLFVEAFDEIKKQTIEGLEDGGFSIESDLSHRIDSEMYEKFKDLNKHYSHRPLSLNDDLWDAYTSLRSECYGLKYLSKIDDSDIEKVQNLVDELIEETQEEKERLLKEKRLKNRFIKAVKSRSPL